MNETLWINKQRSWRCVFLSSYHVCVNHSTVSDSLEPHGLQHTRLLCSCNFPGKNTEVGCHFLLQNIFLTQGLNQIAINILIQKIADLQKKRKEYKKS